MSRNRTIHWFRNHFALMHFLCWNPRPWWMASNMCFFTSVMSVLLSTRSVLVEALGREKSVFHRWCLIHAINVKALLVWTSSSLLLSMGWICMCLFIPLRRTRKLSRCQLPIVSHVLNTGHYHSWTQKPIVNDARKRNNENMFSSSTRWKFRCG